MKTRNRMNKKKQIRSHPRCITKINLRWLLNSRAQLLASRDSHGFSARISCLLLNKKPRRTRYLLVRVYPPENRLLRSNGIILNENPFHARRDPLLFRRIQQTISFKGVLDSRIVKTLGPYRVRENLRSRKLPFSIFRRAAKRKFTPRFTSTNRKWYPGKRTCYRILRSCEIRCSGIIKGIVIGASNIEIV